MVSTTANVTAGLDAVGGATATCPAGYRLTGGSARTDGDATSQDVYINDLEANVAAGTYRARAEQGSTPTLGTGPNWTLTVSAICARIIP